MICVRSSVHVNPAQDFNEWAEYTFNQVKQNYKSKISCTKLDSTSDEANISCTGKSSPS